MPAVDDHRHSTSLHMPIAAGIQESSRFQVCDGFNNIHEGFCYSKYYHTLISLHDRATILSG